MLDIKKGCARNTALIECFKAFRVFIEAMWIRICVRTQ